MKLNLAIVCGAVLALATGSAVSQATVSKLQMTALTSPEDAVSARRLLMTTIGNNNDILHDTFDGYFEYSDREVRGRLDAISTMLLTFPHLYRGEPDVWTPEIEATDPARASHSLPLIWEDWDGFYAMATAAAQTAFEASMTTDREKQRVLIEDLEVQCESCHASYRRELPSVDFDELIGPANP